MKHFTEKSTIKLPEKQVVKETAKESAKQEKHEKSEKVEKEKQEKEKHEKEVKEHKDVKETKDAKEKHEKETKDAKHEHKEHKEKEHSKVEQLEKIQKDIETLPFQEASFPQAAEASAAGLQPAKHLEKLYEKTYDKNPYFEKYHYKDVKYEKLEHKEWDKFYEVPDPGGPVEFSNESRLASLEAAMAQLLHFIPENLRPDLSQGALKSETAEEPSPEASPSEKPEAPSKEAEKGKKS